MVYKDRWFINHPFPNEFKDSTNDGAGASGGRGSGRRGKGGRGGRGRKGQGGRGSGKGSLEFRVGILFFFLALIGLS